MELFRNHIEKAWKAYRLAEDMEYLSVRSYLLQVFVDYFGHRNEPNAPWGFFVELYPYLYIPGKEANLKIKKVGDSALMVAAVIDAKKESVWRRRLGRDTFKNTARLSYGALHERIKASAAGAVIFGTLSKELDRFIPPLAYVLKRGNMLKDFNTSKALRRFSSEYSPDDRQWLLNHGIFVPEKHIIQ